MCASEKGGICFDRRITDSLRERTAASRHFSRLWEVRTIRLFHRRITKSLSRNTRPHPPLLLPARFKSLLFWVLLSGIHKYRNADKERSVFLSFNVSPSLFPRCYAYVLHDDSVITFQYQCRFSYPDVRVWELCHFLLMVK